MALLGPMVVVGEDSAADLVKTLSEAGAFPIVESSWAEARAAMTEVQPVAVAIACRGPDPSPRQVRELTQCIQSRPGPILPAIAIVDGNRAPPIPTALAIAQDVSTELLIARLRAALRIRTMHATVLRRARTAASGTVAVPANLLADATVLCVGRGASYPALSVAIGERVGIIGAFSVESAARYLNSRDIDGLVIGDGLGERVVNVLLSVLADDARFRDLPVGLLNHEAEDDRLPNLICMKAQPSQLVDRLLPFVGLRAFDAHLQRMLRSLDSQGVIDSETGLLCSDAFWCDLEQTIEQTNLGGSPLSIARFCFDGLDDRRIFLDAARLFSRLVRKADFACRESDGSILAVFTETDLRSAHVVARRLASELRNSMLSPTPDRQLIKPSITLATFKPRDNVSTLVARVGAYPKLRSPHQQASM